MREKRPSVKGGKGRYVFIRTNHATQAPQTGNNDSEPLSSDPCCSIPTFLAASSPTKNLSATETNYGSSGTYNLNGGTLAVNGLTAGNGTSAFNFSGGVLQANAGFATSVNTTLSGTATVNTQAYSVAWNGALSGNGMLVKTGSGTLTINGPSHYHGGTDVEGGTLINSNDCSIGDLSGSTCASRVSGAGSMWINEGFFQVGNIGPGTLSITNGGFVSCNMGFIGYYTGSSGTITVDGAGSTLSNYGNYLSVGNFGAGMLSITNGGSVSCHTCYIGNDTGSSGTVSVDGAGSTMKSSGFIIGNAGNGILTITNGGSVSSGWCYVGDGSAPGTVLISGTGSTWDTGNLQIGYLSAGTVAQDAGLVCVNGTVTLGYYAAGTYNLNGGTLAVKGLTTYPTSGGTANFNFNGGVLRADTDFATNVAATLGGTATVNTQDHNVSWDGVLSGDGRLVKTGSGTLTLNGTNTYSGGTDVEGGTLIGTTNNIVGNLNVAGGAEVFYYQSGTVTYAGTLTGNGTVTGDLNTFLMNGVVSPGNSMGTITINSNYASSSSSTYNVDVNSGGQSDLIHVTGSASIQGGTVNVVAASGTYNKSTTYTILTADHGVTGNYDDVTVDLAFLSGSLTSDADDIYLVLSRNGTNFNDVAVTQNQHAVATYLDVVAPTATGDLANVISVLETQTAPDARAAFDAMSGEAYADLGAIDIEAANVFTNALLMRLWDDDCERTPGRNLWFNAIGDWQHQQTAAAYAGYDSPLAGFMIGCDRQFENALCGFAVGYGDSHVTFLDSPATARVDLLNCSGYGRVDFGALYVAGVLGYTHGWNDVDRTIAVSGMTTRYASASLSGDAFGMLLQTGYGIDRGRWRLTPLAGLRYVFDSSGSTTENGADSLDLIVAHDTRTSLSSHLGARLGYYVNRKWRLEGYGQWEHEYADTTLPVSMTFTGDTTSGFTVQGALMPGTAHGRACWPWAN